MLTKELSDRRISFDGLIGMLAIEGKASVITARYVQILKNQVDGMNNEIGDLDRLFSEFIGEADPKLLEDLPSFDAV